MDVYKNFIKEKFDQYKCKNLSDVIIHIPIRDSNNNITAYLKPIIKEFQYFEPDLAKLLTDWRKKTPTIGTGTFEVTVERTQKWLEFHILNRDDRLLFMIYTIDHIPIGHIGFSNIDYDTKTPEIDSVLRGVDNLCPGIMTYATYALIDWGYRNFQFKGVNLSVFSDNEKAISFYEKMGFVKSHQKPLYLVNLGDEIKWEIAPDNYTGEINKYYLYMKYERENPYA